MLFYVENRTRYVNFKNILKEYIKSKFEKTISLKWQNLPLLFDLLSCPYIDEDFKKDLLVRYDITDTSDQDKILNRKEYWFTKWTDFDFGKELEAKKSQEVY